ncbi:MAG: hypothetical protein MSS80_08305 [Mollicutes bacterium]|nr:hypothetical protein [Mollicutes bacterium]
MNSIYLDKEEIYDILCDCGLMTIYTKDYGSLEMTDEDSIMEDFIPQVIDYINEKLEEEKLSLD